MDFSNHLASIRRQKNLSQDQLAEKLNITRQAISKWESGQSMPDLEMLVRLYEILETSTDQLLLGTEPVKKGKSGKANTGIVFFAVTGIFLAVVFVCGIAMYMVNLYNGSFFEPFSHYLGLILVFSSLVSFFVLLLRFVKRNQ